MSLSRRQFLVGSIATGVSLFLPSAQLIAEEQGLSLLCSSCGDSQGQNYISGVDVHGHIHFMIPIPERAHDSVYVPRTRQVIFFGRSPSTTFYIVDVDNKALVKTIKADNGRHFYGHGVVNQEGIYLYTVENNYPQGKGCIGIYDMASGYKKIREFDSFGVGPHQLALLSDNKTMVVANGGLFAHPSQPKKIINQYNFNSSIAYIDAENGQLLHQYRSPDSRNSLRHMAIDYQDNVFIGAQSHSDDILPLVYSHSGENTLMPFHADEFIWLAHHHYTGSLTVIDDTLAVTSPRGGIISFWNTGDRSYLSKLNDSDVAGVIANVENNRNIFFASTGQGFLLDIDATNNIFRGKHHHPVAWDNHLSLVANVVTTS